MRTWKSGFIGLAQLDEVLNLAAGDGWDVHLITPKPMFERFHVILTRTTVEPTPTNQLLIKEGDVLRKRLTRDEVSE